MTFLWFALIALCTTGLYFAFSFLPTDWTWVNTGSSSSQGHNRDLRVTLALVLGFISSLYLIASIFSWAKTKKHPGGPQLPITDCVHCGNEVELLGPAPPPGYRAGCLTMLLVPLITAFLLLPIGRLIEWSIDSPLGGASWILLPIWLALIMLGFGLVRRFRIAALDRRSLDENSRWAHYEQDEARRDESMICPHCGKNPFR